MNSREPAQIMLIQKLKTNIIQLENTSHNEELYELYVAKTLWCAINLGRLIYPDHDPNELWKKFIDD